MKTYTAVSGDMFDSISYAVFGSERYAAALMKANSAYIGRYRFKGGEVLNVPEIDAADGEITVLPPWMGAEG